MGINWIITGGTTMVGAAGRILRIVSSRLPENAPEQLFCVIQTQISSTNQGYFK